MKDQLPRALTKNGEPRCQGQVRKGDTWHSYREQCKSRTHTEGSDFCARHDPNVQANKAQRLKELRRANLKMDEKEAAAAIVNAWLKDHYGVVGQYQPAVYVSDFSDGKISVSLEALEAIARHVSLPRVPVEFEPEEGEER